MNNAEQGDRGLHRGKQLPAISIFFCPPQSLLFCDIRLIEFTATVAPIMTEARRPSSASLLPECVSSEGLRHRLLPYIVICPA